MSGPLHIELILKPYVQLKRGQCEHSLLLLSSPIREISSSSKKFCLCTNINQQEGILAYKVINGTYLLNDFLNHGDVGHQIQLRNDGDLRIPLYCGTCHMASFFSPLPGTTTAAICSSSNLLVATFMPLSCNLLVATFRMRTRGLILPLVPFSRSPRLY